MYEQLIEELNKLTVWEVRVEKGAAPETGGTFLKKQEVLTLITKLFGELNS